MVERLTLDEGKLYYFTARSVFCFVCVFVFKKVLPVILNFLIYFYADCIKVYEHEEEKKRVIENILIHFFFFSFEINAI